MVNRWSKFHAYMNIFQKVSFLAEHARRIQWCAPLGTRPRPPSTSTPSFPPRLCWGMQPPLASRFNMVMIFNMGKLFFRRSRDAAFSRRRLYTSRTSCASASLWLHDVSAMYHVQHSPVVSICFVSEIIFGVTQIIFCIAAGFAGSFLGDFGF